MTYSLIYADDGDHDRAPPHHDHLLRQDPGARARRGEGVRRAPEAGAGREHLPGPPDPQDGQKIHGEHHGPRREEPKKSLIESIATDHPTLKIQTIENAKKILNGSDDVYGLKEEYFEWCKNKEKPYKGYDAGFIGFCKGRMKNNISEEIQDDMFT